MRVRWKRFGPLWCTLPDQNSDASHLEMLFCPAHVSSLNRCSPFCSCPIHPVTGHTASLLADTCYDTNIWILEPIQPIFFRGIDAAAMPMSCLIRHFYGASTATGPRRSIRLVTYVKSVRFGEVCFFGEFSQIKKRKAATSGFLGSDLRTKLKTPEFWFPEFFSWLFFEKTGGFFSVKELKT